MSERIILGISQDRALELTRLVRVIVQGFPPFAFDLEAGLEKISQHKGSEEERLFMAFVFGNFDARLSQIMGGIIDEIPGGIN